MIYLKKHVHILHAAFSNALFEDKTSIWLLKKNCFSGTEFSRYSVSGVELSLLILFNH